MGGVVDALAAARGGLAGGVPVAVEGVDLAVELAGDEPAVLGALTRWRGPGCRG